MTIFRFDATSEKPREYVLGLQDKFVTDVTFKLANNGDLYCSFKDAVAGLVTVSSAGKMERRKVFNAKEDTDALMVPADGGQISPNELFFVTTKFLLFGNKKLRIGVVRVN